MMFKKYKLLIAAVVLSVGLQGCSTPKNVEPATALLSQNKTVLKTLSTYGVSIMQLGDRVVITIPSLELFQGYSVQFSDSANTLLSQIAMLLKPMNKVKITIAAYAESMAQTKKDLMLTQLQAQTVSNYLWDQHVDARLLYAIGYGGGHPVQYDPNKAKNGIIGDRVNYRIEITLKDYVQ